MAIAHIDLHGSRECAQGQDLHINPGRQSFYQALLDNPTLLLIGFSKHCQPHLYTEAADEV